MPLKTSISITTKFFQKTLKSFKSLFNGGYQKLPKTPPFETNITQHCKELDNFYNDFTQRWDSKTEQRKQSKQSKQRIKKEVNERGVHSGGLLKTEKFETLGESKEAEKKKRTLSVDEGDRGKTEKVMVKPICGRETEEVLRPCLVAEKLKELEMIDKSNIEHVLDIEEVLHYYSKLTCPAYVDIVDKFFMEMYAEINPSLAH